MAATRSPLCERFSSSEAADIGEATFVDFRSLIQDTPNGTIMITPSAKTGLPTLLRLAPFAAACLWTSPSPAQSLVTNGTFEAEVIDPWWTHAS